MIGALVVYLMHRGEVPYFDKAEAKRRHEWYRTAPPAGLNYQQIVRRTA